MRDILYRRNLIYGECDFILSKLDGDLVVILAGDYHKGHLFDCYKYDVDGYIIPAYNRKQFMVAVDLAMDMGSDVVIYRPERIFSFDMFHLLNNILYKLLIRYDKTVIILSSAISSRRFPPPPYMPHFVRHLCDVVAYARRGFNAYVLYLLKHPTLPYSKVSIRCLDGEEFPELPVLLEKIGK